MFGQGQTYTTFSISIATDASAPESATATGAAGEKPLRAYTVTVTNTGKASRFPVRVHVVQAENGRGLIGAWLSFSMPHAVVCLWACVGGRAMQQHHRWTVMRACVRKSKLALPAGYERNRPELMCAGAPAIDPTRNRSPRPRSS